MGFKDTKAFIRETMLILCSYILFPLVTLNILPHITAHKKTDVHTTEILNSDPVEWVMWLSIRFRPTRSDLSKEN